MIRVRALGQCVVEVGDHQITPESAVLFALLLFLSSRAGHVVSRDDILDLLWADSTPTKARHRLRQAIYQLKKLGAPLSTDGAQLMIAKGDVEVDCADANHAATVARTTDPATLDYLPAYAPRLSRRFAQWVDGERDRVRGMLRHALLSGIRESRASHVSSCVIAFARAYLRLDPLNSEATLALAESLAVEGRSAEALGVLDHLAFERNPEDSEALNAGLALRRRIGQIRQNVPALSGETPLVGRDPILSELAGWLAGRASRSMILTLSAETGMGKSRLLNEAKRIATLKGVRCVEYRSNSAGVNRHLAGLLDLLPQLLALPGAVGCTPDSYARLTELAQGGTLHRSGPVDKPDSAFRFATLRRSVRDLIEAVVAENEVLFALDDAHALDRASLEILLDAAGHRTRLLVLIAMRPVGPTAEFIERKLDTRLVRLTPLDRAASLKVLTRDWPRDLADERSRLISWALDLADGNPFYLVELAAHCRGNDPSEALPASLQVALDRRFDSLSSTARLLLQTCSVLGGNATAARLDEALGLPPYIQLTALGELESAGLIAWIAGRVVCRHDLIADAVIRGLGAAQRTYLHRRCAVVLDRELRTSPAASLAWDCAHHWDAAGEHTRAFELTLAIADRLLALGLPSESIDLCTRADRYCSTPAQHADRLLRVGRALRVLDNWTGVIDVLEKRQSLIGAQSSGSTQYREDEIAIVEARWWRDHDGKLLIPTLRRVRDVGAPTHFRLQMAVTGLVIADNHQRKRDATRIIDLVESMVVRTTEEVIERTKAQLIYHTAFGNLDVAVEAGAQVLASERQGSGSAALLRALRWSSIPLKLSGRKAEAVAALEEAYLRAEHLGLRAEMWNAAEYLTILATDWQDIALGSRWGPICLSISAQDKTFADKAVMSKYLMAGLMLAAGNFSRARTLLAEANGTQGRVLLRTRARESMVAIHLALRIRLAETIPIARVAELRRLHLRTRECGVRDFETGALLNGLIATGQLADASQLLGEYLHRFRRSRIPLHPLLTEASNKLNVA